MRQIINIVVNPSYSKTNWFSDFYNGVLSRKDSADINVILCNNNYEEISSFCKNNNYVILVSSSTAWENEVISFLLSKNIHCIIIRPSTDNHSASACSNVSPDYFSATFDIMKYFIETGSKKIAFFAYNTDSLQDIQKFKAYEYALSLSALNFTESDVYYNHGNVELCADSIINTIDTYDALLCANDAAAIVLINRLKNKEVLKKISVASFGNTKLLKMIFPDVISASLNFKKAGEYAADLYLYLCENNSVTSCEYKVKSDIYIPHPKERVCNLNQKNPVVSEKEIFFYNDSAVIDIFKDENTLALCDELDIKIISSILNNFSYEKTAEHTNTAVTTVKYRLKKIYSHFGVNSKKELCDYFDKYINSK